MLMLGQRGSGKTVLLWELADRARKLGFVVATPTVASGGYASSALLRRSRKRASLTSTNAAFPNSRAAV